MIFGGLAGSTSGVSAGLAATGPAFVPYGAQSVTFILPWVACCALCLDELFSNSKQQNFKELNANQLNIFE